MPEMSWLQLDYFFKTLDLVLKWKLHLGHLYLSVI